MLCIVCVVRVLCVCVVCVVCVVFLWCVACARLVRMCAQRAARLNQGPKFVTPCRPAMATMPSGSRDPMLSARSVDGALPKRRWPLAAKEWKARSTIRRARHANGGADVSDDLWKLRIRSETCETRQRVRWPLAAERGRFPGGEASGNRSHHPVHTPTLRTLRIPRQHKRRQKPVRWPLAAD